MKISKFLTLNLNDGLKGLLIAILTAVLTAVYNLLQEGGTIDWKLLITTGLLAGISYILKNFLSNSEGEIAKKEKK